MRFFVGRICPYGGTRKEGKMENLTILFKPKGSQESKITIPIKALNVGIKFLPKELRSTLDTLGIDLEQTKEIAKDKALKGTFIEIENPGLKLVISTD